MKQGDYAKTTYWKKDEDYSYIWENRKWETKKPEYGKILWHNRTCGSWCLLNQKGERLICLEVSEIRDKRKLEKVKYNMDVQLPKDLEIQKRQKEQAIQAYKKATKRMTKLRKVLIKG